MPFRNIDLIRQTAPWGIVASTRALYAISTSIPELRLSVSSASMCPGE